MRNTRPPFKGPRTPDSRNSKSGRPDNRASDRSAGRSDKPRSDRPRTDKPRGDKPYGDKKPYAAKPYGDKSRGDKPRNDKPRSDRPFTPKFRDQKTPGTYKPAPARDAKPPRVKDTTGPRLTGPLLWGFHAVRAAWMNKDRRIVKLIVTDAGLAGFKDALESCTLKRPAPEIVDKMLFDRLLPAGAVHQGVVAMVESLPGRDAHDLIAALGDNEKAVIVILDQVTDPHNVGAIMRSAAAFGAKGIIMQERHTPEFTGVLAKTASGAADVIPVATETNLSRAIEVLQEAGFFVVGLDERGDDIAGLPAHDRVALVLGAEGSGLRPNVANHCDPLVSLPTEGPIFSLNVSNAAAVALYAIKSR